MLMNIKPKSTIKQSGKSASHLAPKSKEYLCSLFDYDPKDGRLLRKSGKEAGSKKCRKRDGHRSTIQVCLSNGDGTWNLHSAHRIIYQMMGVEVPDGMVIDHINNDPWDNRWDNFRLITQRENCRNRGASRGKTSDLPRCVFKRGNGKFFANINSGSMDTIDLAVNWRDWAISILTKSGIYSHATIKSGVKPSGLPRAIYQTWSSGRPKGFEARIHRGNFESAEEAVIWRNQAEVILFGEVLHRSSE